MIFLMNFVMTEARLMLAQEVEACGVVEVKLLALYSKETSHQVYKSFRVWIKTLMGSSSSRLARKVISSSKPNPLKRVGIRSQGARQSA